MKKNYRITLLAIACLALLGLQAATAASLDSAVLHIYVSEASGETVNVHKITSPWIEDEVTWSSFAGGYDPFIETSFVAAPAGWYAVDITAVVMDWLNGEANNGILLDQDDTQYSVLTIYHSREATTNQPYLELTFTTTQGTTVEQVPAAADAYIWEPHPQTNGGLSQRLYTGWFTPTILEKQSLIRFDLEEARLGTPGYWKTHSTYGPAPYDATWAMLPNGADTIFFLSGQTYYEVLWTQPKKGNAYYNLSRAFIAAELNVLGGASMSQTVQDAFDAAEVLFLTYTPKDIGKLKGKDPLRKDFIHLAEILDDFNNGISP